MSLVTVSVGDLDLNFDIGVDDYNQQINETMPNDKVAPAFNLLSRTVTDECKDDFKKIALIDGKPNGFVVMQIAGLAIGEFSGGVEISLKKPKKSAKA